jgi:Ser/Thr protein kinase RdoA (MazF antagonist)
MTAVPRTSLAAPARSRPPAAIVEMLAAALRALHSVSARDCPFESYVPGKSLVHGDACPPNIMVGDDGPSGYIDLGDMGAGDVEVDLSAAVWSLQYNLGPGFGRAFLTAYGRPDATDRDVDRLSTMYATRGGNIARRRRVRPRRADAWETFFVMKEKRATRTQNLREKTTFQDLSTRLPDMPDISGGKTNLILVCLELADVGRDRRPGRRRSGGPSRRSCPPR